MVHHEQLTTIRYADELLLYARSLPVLVEMIETLSCELHQTGQQLIAAKRCQEENTHNQAAGSPKAC